MKRRRLQLGWTLVELLIIVSIVAILASLFLLLNWKRSLWRAYDARRKTDVANVRRAFEEYFNDHNCYPSLTVLNTCGGAELAPYLAKIPCDPTTKEPYKYQPDSESNLCTGNRVCVKLQDYGDPDIVTLGCDAINGCGWGAYWNYCLATGTTVTAPGFVPGISPTPLPSPTPSYLGPYACRRGGVCNNVGDPASLGCPQSWAESDCQNLCSSSVYWCPQ